MNEPNHVNDEAAAPQVPPARAQPGDPQIGSKADPSASGETIE